MLHKVEEMQQFNKIVSIISILLQFKAFVLLKPVMVLPLTLQGWSASPSCFKWRWKEVSWKWKAENSTNAWICRYILPSRDFHQGRNFWESVLKNNYKTIGQNGFSELVLVNGFHCSENRSEKEHPAQLNWVWSSGSSCHSPPLASCICTHTIHCVGRCMQEIFCRGITCSWRNLGSLNQGFGDFKKQKSPSHCLLIVVCWDLSSSKPMNF